MIRTDELRGAIAKKGLSQRKLAQMLGMSEKTFYSKMKRGIFRSDEIEKMVLLLEINDPFNIFFAHVGTQHAPKK